MATISGTVEDSSGNFAARMVRAYRRSDGAFAGQAISNATTGEYSITALDISAHFVIAFDGVAEEGDPYWYNNVLGMHMDGDNAGTVFTDIKGHTITLYGNVQTRTATYKFGTASAYFDGAGDYLSTTGTSDFAFGTGDFTIELWVNTTDTNSALIDFWANSATSWQVFIDSTGKIQWYTTSGVSSASAINTGTWKHVAVVRQSGVRRVYVQGALDSTMADATNYSTVQSYLSIGAQVNNRNATYDLTGYIDDLRITKGVARYTAAFTPPTSAFLGSTTIGTPVENALIFDNITPV